MTISELADFLTLEPEILFDGNYRNRRGIVGYFVQLKCDDHWVRVSVSNVASVHGGMSVAEMDVLTKADLIAQKPFIVKVRTIGMALRQIGVRGCEWKPYENSMFVPGVWLEQEFGGHWYMVSVSRVEGLDRASPERIDEGADEFLRRMGAFDESVRPVTRKRRWA